MRPDELKKLAEATKFGSRPTNGNGGSNGTKNGNGPSNGGTNGTNGSNPHPVPGPPGTSGHPVEVQSNIFGLVVNQHQRIYRYDVSILGTSRDNVEDFSDNTLKPVWITKKAGADFYTTERKQMAGKVFEMLFAKFPEEFCSPICAFYDRQSILFTVQQLKSNKIFKLMKLTPEEAVGPLAGFTLLEATVSLAAANGELPIECYKEMDNTLMGVNRDRSLFQFLQIGLLQQALLHPDAFLVFEKGKVYMKKAQDFGVPPIETKKLPDGKELKAGCKLSVQVIEGPKGRERANLAVAIDAKKAAFHQSTSMPQKAIEILQGFDFSRPCTAGQLDKLNTVLKGLMITTTHIKDAKEKKAYKITGVKFDSSYVLNLPDKKMTVREYYDSKYGVKLLAPLAPLIIVQAKKETFFPMEVCAVLPDQRVTFVQQTPEQMKETTKECAVAPIRRQNLIVHNTQALEIHDTKHETFRVIANPIKLAGRQLNPPIIQYNNGHVSSIDTDRFSWRTQRGAHYLIPGSIDCWAFVVIGKQRVNVNQFVPLAERVYNEAGSRGIKLNPPATSMAIEANDLEKTFKLMADNGVHYLLMVTDDLLMIQDEIKSLERKYEIMTQNIKMRTARDVIEKGKAATTENLCNKMNIKLGGINYSIKINGTTLLQKGETMVLGIGSAVPPAGIALDGGQRMPTVVGYSANISADVDAFCGDFELVDSTLAENQLIGGIILQRAIDEWQKIADLQQNGRKRPSGLPENLIVYRGGVPDTAYDKMISSEIPAIREVLKQYDLGNDKKIKLTYIVVTKDHATRLFKGEINPEDRPNKQNVEPGFVVDTILTSPKYKQFYLNSHVALQGTALTPLYTLLCDDKDWSMDEIEIFSYQLCYMHQIVSLPTSLPTPLYVANRYADRGRRMVVQHLKNETAAGKDPSTVDFFSQDTTKKIGYKDSKFANIRVNA